jgi:hypothetical protein
MSTSTTLLEAIKSATSFAEFHVIWAARGDEMQDYLATCPSDAEELLNEIERCLNLGPTEDVYAVDIANATPSLLRELNCAYDMWALLGSHGRQHFVRGKVTEWETHEKPLVESYRLEVKARLARLFDEKISLFERAGDAAGVGATDHCRNRARLMRAHAVRLRAAQAVRKGELCRAADLFRQAKTLAQKTDLEPFVAFWENACLVRHKEVTLKWDEALSAHAAALEAANSMRYPHTLFQRPNPWTSLTDFQNERHFIETLRLLQDERLGALDASVATLRTLRDDCGESVRQYELGARLLALEGLRSATSGPGPVFDEQLSELSSYLRRPAVPRNTRELLECLREIRGGSRPDDVLDRVITLMPLDSIGTKVADPAPLLYGAPIWLQRLVDADDANAPRLLLTLYARLVLDFLWSIYEKNERERARVAIARPSIEDASLARLAELAEGIVPLLMWEGAPAADLRRFAEGLSHYASGLSWGDDLEREIRHLLRATEHHLLPLAVRVQVVQPVVEEGAVARECTVVLRRLDGLGTNYTYALREIDFGGPDGSSRRGYLKARYRSSLQQPRDPQDRPLHVYAAAALPEFRSACLIVEGVSDAAFFAGLLDRIEPGWDLLQDEVDPRYPVIEIKVAGGASEIPDVYETARKEGRFHTTDPLLDAGAERIVVIVDADRADIFSSKADISRARHRVVLRPDLERVALSAFLEALSVVITRSLTADEERDLVAWSLLEAKVFQTKVEDRWGVQLKRQANGKDAESFARVLARVFPLSHPGSTWERVWMACDRLLRLARGRGRLCGLAEV